MGEVHESQSFFRHSFIFAKIYIIIIRQYGHLRNSVARQNIVAQLLSFLYTISCKLLLQVA